MNWKIRLLELVSSVVMFIILRSISVLVDFETVVITALSIIICNQIFVNNSKD